MSIVLLKFSDNKANAGQFMEGHNAWLKRGFDEGVFLLAGTIQPKLGGGIIAHTSHFPRFSSAWTMTLSSLPTS